MSTLVYKYRILPLGGAKARREVLDHPDLMEQFRLAHELQNKFVEIEREYEQGKTDLWSSYPHIADLEKAVTAAETALSEVSDRASKHRSSTRGKKLPPGLMAELKTAKQARTAAKTQRREAISAVLETAQPRLDELFATRTAARKALYASYCQEGNLYWATYNAVLDDHKVSAKRVADRRAKGLPCEMRFQRWDGTGRIAVQLQRGAGQPPRTPERIAGPKGKWANVMQIRQHPDVSSPGTPTPGASSDASAVAP